MRRKNTKMFWDDFDKYPILATDLERMCCPRVHFIQNLSFCFLVFE